MLIGLHGKKQAGKDAAYQRLVALGMPARRRAFADKLYASAAAALGVTPDVLRAGKTDPDATVEVFASILGEPDGADLGAINNLGIGRVAAISVRWYLQLYGTEAHREIFGDNFWVEQLDLTHAPDEIICITDCRFPNEADAIRAAGGFVLQVIGPPEVEDNTDMHASEFPLPDELVDYVVMNDTRDDGYVSLDEQLMAVIDLANAGIA